MSTVPLGRPGPQHQVQMPASRPSCKWRAEGHQGLALAAETERKSGGRHAPSSPSHPRPPRWKTEKWGFRVTGTRCVTSARSLPSLGLGLLTWKIRAILSKNCEA